MLNGVEVHELSGKVVRVVVTDPVCQGRIPTRHTCKGWIITVEGSNVDFDRKAKMLSLPLDFKGPVECQKVYKDTAKQREAFNEMADIIKAAVL